MSALLLIGAFAQAATSAGSTATPTTDTTGPGTLGASTYVDAEAGLGYSTNPFLMPNSGGEGFGRFSLRLVHTRVSDRTTTLLSAYAQDTTYTGRYRSAQSFDLNGRHDAAINEKLRVYIDGDAAYDRGGQLDTRILAVPDVPLLPGSVVPPQLLTPGSDFLSISGRSYHAQANAGAQMALSEHGFLDISTGLSHAVFKSGDFDTRYTTVPLSIGYDQQVSERATVGGRVVAEFIDYGATATTLGSPSYRVITPELTGQLKLSERLTLSGDVGASFSSIRQAGETHNSTGFAGDLNLCEKGERTQFCARASVQEQAATSVGPSRVASVGVDYSRRLTADDTIRFSLSGVRYSNPIILVSGVSFSRATYLRAAADYSRKIGRRLFGGIDLAARRVTDGPAPQSDFTASVFIRYRFGDIR